MEETGNGAYDASSGSDPSGTMSPLVHLEGDMNSGSIDGANTELIGDVRSKSDGVGEGLRESLLSKYSHQQELKAGEPTFDPAANPSSFESQTDVTKLVYKILNLKWHDNVFDKDAPMAPQMYVLYLKIFCYAGSWR